ncbi:MAG: MBOAT family protein [Ruminococcaceae bacterium]|nr:MBOAT family protein [Oscillospiraceae bacterium]
MPSSWLTPSPETNFPLFACSSFSTVSLLISPSPKSILCDEYTTKFSACKPYIIFALTSGKIFSYFLCFALAVSLNIEYNVFCKPTFFDKDRPVSFSDLRFIFYILPPFVLLHTVLPSKYRNALLFFGSLGIYAFGAGLECAGILLGMTALNYLFGRWMKDEEPYMRRAFLGLGLFLDFLSLFFFKYLTAVFDVLARFGYDDYSFLHIALPLGVSFYIFQMTAYLIDVCRGAVEPETSFIDFGAFVSAFPQLTMGPILRYGDVRKALKDRKPGRVDIEQGFQLFCIGLSFKVLLADQLAYLWVVLERIGFDYISTPLAWLGAVGYSLQLYFDFQGYSLMAMGLGGMLALPVARNFDDPYLSRSVSDFYRRWHMTLGTWFRDYLYIPLGGSRRGTARTLLSLAVVWLLTGLWHGPTVNYLIWGGVLFVFIALEKLFLRKTFGKLHVLPHLYLLFVIVQTWVIFRVESLSDLLAYFRRLYPFFGDAAAINYGDFLKYFTSYWWLFAIGVFLCLPWPRRWYERARGNALVWVPLFALFWTSVYFLSTGSGSEFLYFRF